MIEVFKKYNQILAMFLIIIGALVDFSYKQLLPLIQLHNPYIFAVSIGLFLSFFPTILLPIIPISFFYPMVHGHTYKDKAIQKYDFERFDGTPRGWFVKTFTNYRKFYYSISTVTLIISFIHPFLLIKLFDNYIQIYVSEFLPLISLSISSLLMTLFIFLFSFIFTYEFFLVSKNSNSYIDKDSCYFLIEMYNNTKYSNESFGFNNSIFYSVIKGFAFTLLFFASMFVILYYLNVITNITLLIISICVVLTLCAIILFYMVCSLFILPNWLKEHKKI